MLIKPHRFLGLALELWVYVDYPPLTCQNLPRVLGHRWNHTDQAQCSSRFIPSKEQFSRMADPRSCMRQCHNSRYQLSGMSDPSFTRNAG